MSNQNLLERARETKAQVPIEQEVAAAEAEVTAKVAAEAEESVHIEGWGTFHRRGDGWHGPGGYYGPGAPMAQKCEEALESKRRDAYQRHHDHYVRLHREGLLTPEDEEQYKLAMAREQAGEVQPLPED